MPDLSVLKQKLQPENIKFITKLELTSDLQRMSESFSLILEQATWGVKNQIGLNYRPGAENVWHDAAGKIYDPVRKIMLGKETDFTEWNIIPEYLRQQINIVASTHKFTPGRVRFMRLMPKTGLSVHSDDTFRYHYVIKTNPHSYIAQKYNITKSDSDVASTYITYHLPDDGYWYKVDTRQSHWVYNGGQEERIHLVMCG